MEILIFQISTMFFTFCVIIKLIYYICKNKLVITELRDYVTELIHANDQKDVEIAELAAELHAINKNSPYTVIFIT